MFDIGNIKKLKLLDKLVIWTSNNKVHVKDLEKPDSDVPLMF